MVEQNKAIEVFEKLIEEGRSLLAGQHSATARTWHLDATAALARVFGEDSRQLSLFNNIRWTPHIHIINEDNSDAYRGAHRHGFAKSIALLEAACNEIRQWGITKSSDTQVDVMARIERICNRFHVVTRQLRSRYEDRPTLDVADEYDVQERIFVRRSGRRVTQAAAHVWIFC